MTVSSSSSSLGIRKDDKKDTKSSVTATSRLLAGAMGGMDTAITQTSLPSAPSHVLSVLNSRPEPKHVRLFDRARCEKYDANMSRSMNAAGRYSTTNACTLATLSLLLFLYFTPTKRLQSNNDLTLIYHLLTPNQTLTYFLVQGAMNTSHTHGATGEPSQWKSHVWYVPLVFLAHPLLILPSFFLLTHRHSLLIVSHGWYIPLILLAHLLLSYLCDTLITYHDTLTRSHIIISSHTLITYPPIH